MFQAFRDSSILIHVPFHFGEHRLPYLKQVLSTFLTYEFGAVCLVIDTNTRQTEQALGGLLTKSGFDIDVCVHDDLEDPYLLTWVHRNDVFARRNEFDYFMYCEDDLLISFEALERWREDSSFLLNYGYQRGFIRVERDSRGAAVLTDFVYWPTAREILLVQGKAYLHPRNPYFGAWIYPKELMEQFVSSPCWLHGNCEWGVRERAAAGMIWKDWPSHTVLIPLTDDLFIDRDCTIEHLPSNYGLDPSCRYGKLQLDLVSRHLRMSAPRLWLIEQWRSFCRRVSRLRLRLTNTAAHRQSDDSHLGGYS